MGSREENRRPGVVDEPDVPMNRKFVFFIWVIVAWIAPAAILFYDSLSPAKNRKE